MDTILEAKQLRKTYSIDTREQTVLNDVDVQIRQGEFVSVMGPSGSGKSTLLYNISGMDRMTAGSVMFNGQELSALSEKEMSALRLRKMGFVFQQFNLLKNLGIRDNIVVSAYMARNGSRKEIDRFAVELMEKTGIAELADRDITQASGGQLQRAAICRALINKPDMIFGDEPTGALNSASAHEIMEIFREVNQSGTTIMLVTHDVKVASKTERVLFMIDGKIEGELALGKVQQSNQPKQQATEREATLSKWLLEMGW